jgi:WD40 repeat protein
MTCARRKSTLGIRHQLPGQSIAAKMNASIQHCFANRCIVSPAQRRRWARCGIARFINAHLLLVFLADAPLFAQPANIDKRGDPLRASALACFGSTRLRYANPNEERARPVFTPDGRFLFTGHGDSVEQWDLTTGQIVQRWVAPWQPISDLVISADGKRLAVVAGGGVGYLPLPKGERIQKWIEPAILGGKLQQIGWCGFLPDGQSLITILAHGRIRRTSLLPEVREQFADYDNAHPWASPSADGKKLVVWNQDKVDFWDVEKLKKTGSVPFPYLGKFRALRMRADGSLFAIEFKEGIIFWEPATQKVVGKLDAGQVGIVLGLDFTPDGRHLITVSTIDSSLAAVRLWDVASGKKLKEFPVPQIQAGDPVLSQDGRTLTFVCSRPIIPLWDWQAGRAMFDRGGLAAEPAALAFTGNGQITALGGQQICTWRISDGTLMLDRIPPMPCDRILAHPMRNQFFATGPNGAQAPWLFDAKTGQEIGSFDLPSGVSLFPGQVAITGDGRSLLGLGESGSNRTSVRLKWDLDSRKLVNQSKLSDKGPRQAFSPPYRLQFTPLELDQSGSTAWQVDVHSLDGDYLLFRAGKETLPQQLLAAGNVLVAVSWPLEMDSPQLQVRDSPVRFHFSGEAKIEVWEIVSGERVFQCTTRYWQTGSSHEFGNAVLSPDGRILALSLGHEIVLINVDNGQVHKKLSAGSSVRCLAFSADSALLASGQTDTTVLVWDVADVTKPSINSPRLTDAEAEVCWKDLAADAKIARRAQDRLIADPAKAIVLCQRRLKPAAPVPAERLQKLIADLNAERYAVRQAATRDLAALGEQAAAAMQSACQSYLPPETRRRLCAVLAQPYLVRSPEVLQQIRAIGLLERIGTPAAVAVLRDLAAGEPLARETQAATTALQHFPMPDAQTAPR